MNSLFYMSVNAPWMHICNMLRDLRHIATILLASILFRRTENFKNFKFPWNLGEASEFIGNELGKLKTYLFSYNVYLYV